MYAAGKIPGGFIKREARPSEGAILAARLTDRPIRPLFPEGYKDDVQCVLTVLSTDQENDPDILGTIAASAALTISEIPFLGPVAAVRIGRIDGEFVINPTTSQLDAVGARPGRLRHPRRHHDGRGRRQDPARVGHGRRHHVRPPLAAADHRPPGAAAGAGRQGQARALHRARRQLRGRLRGRRRGGPLLRRLRHRDHQPRRQARRARGDRRRARQRRHGQRPLLDAGQAQPRHRRQADPRHHGRGRGRRAQPGRGGPPVHGLGRRRHPRRPQRRLRHRLPGGRPGGRHAPRAGSLPGHARPGPRRLPGPGRPQAVRPGRVLRAGHGPRASRPGRRGGHGRAAAPPGERPARPRVSLQEGRGRLHPHAQGRWRRRRRGRGLRGGRAGRPGFSKGLDDPAAQEDRARDGPRRGHPHRRSRRGHHPTHLRRGRPAAARPRLRALHARRDAGAHGGHAGPLQRRAAHRHHQPGGVQALPPPLQHAALQHRREQDRCAAPAGARSATARSPSEP